MEKLHSLTLCFHSLGTYPKEILKKGTYKELITEMVAMKK